MENQGTLQKTRLDANWSYRRQGFNNLLHMGHCAPTVMQTLLDVSSIDHEWLVKLSAGMPGGIGNTGHECGAITSPLVMLGLKYGLEQADHELPVIFEKGYRHCQNFLACQKTLQCREIRGDDHFPRHCIPPVLRSAELYEAALDGNHGDPIPPARRSAYITLYSHLSGNDFHCAQAVFRHLGYTPEANPDLFKAASAFIGGTLFLGGTCSAFTAGVMAIGLRSGEIEDSIPRVVRLLAIMTVDGNAFDEKLNKFNHSMNLGYKLSKRFAKEFGSTQCREITGCDFSDPAGAHRYIEAGCVTHCKQIAEQVADHVQAMLA